MAMNHFHYSEKKKNIVITTIQIIQRQKRIQTQKLNSDQRIFRQVNNSNITCLCHIPDTKFMKYYMCDP